MKTRDQFYDDALARLRDIESIIKKGQAAFKENIKNEGQFWFRNSLYTLLDLKNELDSYGAERRAIQKCIDYYDEIIF